MLCGASPVWSRTFGLLWGSPGGLEKISISVACGVRLRTSEIPSPAMLGRSARKNELMAKAQHKITRGKLRPKKHLWLPPEDKSLGLRLCILENKPNELAHPFQTGQGHERPTLRYRSGYLFREGCALMSHHHQTSTTCSSFCAKACSSPNFAGLFVVFSPPHFPFDTTPLHQFAEAADRFLNRLAFTQDQFDHPVTSFLLSEPHGTFRKKLKFCKHRTRCVLCTSYVG